MAHTTTQTFHPLKETLSETRKTVTDKATFLQRAMQVANERRQLRRLDADQLKDIGLTEEQAKAEAGRKFWDI